MTASTRPRRVVVDGARPWRDEELRLYLGLLALAVAALAVKLAGRGVYEGEEVVRQALFQAVSIMTTTGYASADFNEWPIFAGMVLVGLMFLGGKAARADLTWPEALSAAAATLGNVGPGLGFLGPMGSYESFSDASKGIMVVLMWAGRLELVPVGVLFMRSYRRA